jgi:hypothetical protein
MYYLNVTSNIMSLGGLALAIGVLVDAAIVMVENAYRHLSDPGHPVAYRDQPRVIVDAARQVRAPSSSRWRSSSSRLSRCFSSKRRKAGCSGRSLSPRPPR